MRHLLAKKVLVQTLKTIYAHVYESDSLIGTGILAGIAKKDSPINSSCFSLRLPVDSLRPEGYWLWIGQDNILIAGADEAGLFYGIQTCIQLFSAYRQSGTIPGIIVLDYPAFPFRGVMDDISRVRLASLKINVLSFYIEHVLKTSKHHAYAPSDGLTLREISELNDFARSYNVSLMGSFQSLGHYRNILSHPDYQHLGFTDRMLLPGDPNVLTFLEEVYKELFPVFSHLFFNLNCDEAWDLENFAAQNGFSSPAEAYTDHVTPLLNFVSEQGKIPAIWGDMVLQYPDILKTLPKETIIFTWNYSPLPSYETFISPIVDAVHPFVVCPGVLNSDRIIPDFSVSRINIREFIQEGFQHGALGVLNTVWDDGGAHFFSRDWYGVAYGADQSWNPHTTNDSLFDDRFTQTFYPELPFRFPELIHLLNHLSTGYTFYEMTNASLYQDILPVSGHDLGLYIKEWPAILEICKKASTLLETVNKGVSGKTMNSSWKKDLTYWQFTVDQIQTIGSTQLELIRIAEIYSEISTGIIDERNLAQKRLSEMVLDVNALANVWQKLGMRFKHLWLEENRLNFLGEGLEVYEKKESNLRDLASRIQKLQSNLDVIWPAWPDPSEVRLSIEPLDYPALTYWLITGPFSNFTSSELNEVDSYFQTNDLSRIQPIAGEIYTAADGRNMIWQKHMSAKSNRVYFSDVYNLDTAMTAFAYSVLESKTAREIAAEISSESDLIVYTNGDRTFTSAGTPVRGDKYVFTIALKAGRNHILIKSTGSQESWGFSLQLPGIELRHHKYKYKIGT
jgi:hexosaminidase